MARTTTLHVLNWAPELELELEQRIARGYEERHPGVRVVVESVVNNFGEKLAAAIASGSPPDVFLLDVPDIPAFVERGLVLDLAPYLSRVAYDRRDVYPAVLDVFTRGERVFAFPKDFTPMVVYFNRRVFDAAGVTAPGDAGWTWEAFRHAARAVTRDTDGDGRTDVFAVDFPRDLYAWVSWVWSAGGDILSPDGTKAAGYMDGPLAVETYRFLTDLALTDGVMPPVQYTLGGDVSRTGRFFSGRQAMLVSGHWSLPLLLKYAARGDLDLGVAPIPHREGATPTTAIYVSGWAVPANVKHRRQAVELAAWLSGVEAQQMRAATRLGISALRSVAEAHARDDATGIESAFLRQVERGRMPWGAVVMDFHRVERLSFDIMDRRLIEGTDVQISAREVARAVDDGWPR
ncbi:MAG: sugar ABC transporter substrate-binding protein [Vicinamibacterales bacterium]